MGRPRNQSKSRPRYLRVRVGPSFTTSELTNESTVVGIISGCVVVAAALKKSERSDTSCPAGHGRAGAFKSRLSLPGIVRTVYRNTRVIRSGKQCTNAVVHALIRPIIDTAEEELGSANAGPDATVSSISLLIWESNRKVAIRSSVNESTKTIRLRTVVGLVAAFKTETKGIIVALRFADVRNVFRLGPKNLACHNRNCTTE